MKVVGFSFSKISVERKKSSFEDLKLSTNIDVSEIKEVKADFFRGREELVGIEFKFNLDYTPDIASIELKGNVVLALEPKIAKELLKDWKNKKMPPDFRLNLFNLILRKSTLKCLQLEDELNLPLHMRLPALKLQEEEKKE